MDGQQSNKPCEIHNNDENASNNSHHCQVIKANGSKYFHPYVLDMSKQPILSAHTFELEHFTRYKEFNSKWLSCDVCGQLLWDINDKTEIKESYYRYYCNSIFSKFYTS
jgi:hypothetical protein